LQPTAPRWSIISASPITARGGSGGRGSNIADIARLAEIP
jgi:hypothetical protein